MVINDSNTLRKCHVLPEPGDKVHGKNIDGELDEIRENVCCNPGDLKTFDGRDYCIFHFPGKDKPGFDDALKERLSKVEQITKGEIISEDGKEIKSAYVYDFRYVWFPSKTDFRKYEFSGNVNFSSAVFSDKVNFYQAKFSADIFFDNVKFNAEASFNSVIFGKDSDVLFRYAFFAGYVSFRYATAEGYLRFANIDFSEKGYMSFNEAAFEKASRISFTNMTLRPGWFVGIDSRKMIFTDIRWKNLSKNFKNENLFAELRFLARHGTRKPKRLFSITCRQLAENAESSSQFEDASNFRRLAMETEWFERTEKLTKKPEDFLDFLRKLRDIPLYSLYRFSSSYGERWGRAFSVLLIILALFAFIYTQVNFYNDPENKVSNIIDKCKTNPYQSVCGKNGLVWKEAVMHSLTTATFQNVDNRKPASDWAEMWVMLEKFFVPLQAALLALAIRRKFMR